MRKPSPRPQVIDLFSGVGGLSLGFEQAGFDVIAAIDSDPVHAAVHHYNFPDCAMLAKPVEHLSGGEILRQGSQTPAGPLTVIGGAPCQGFSTIGQRALDDPRNLLVKEYIRLVDELDAAYFVFENVKGLTQGKHKAFLSELIEEFESKDYQVRLPWRILDAAHYGVPQHRERLILIGAKKGLTLPRYPEPQTSPPQSCLALSWVSTTPTCLEALGDLPNADDFEQLLACDEVPARPVSRVSPYAAEMRGERRQDWHFGYRRHWDAHLLTSSMRTAHTAISRRRFAETRQGENEPISRFFRLPADGLSNTLRAGTGAARGAFTSPRPIHYEHPRCITVREMARLHGFPDWFRLHQTKWHGARQVGNAVPPPLARAVAEQILVAMELRPTRPTSVRDLGSKHLLHLTLSQAAEWWGVPKPPTRRTHRSGLKKRRQEEIEALRLANI